VQPTQVVDGLAEYRRGDGLPVFVVPYPHASTTGPMAAGPLADICVGAGFEVLSFDPPGYGQSSRLPKTSIEEMVECTGQVLDDFHVDRPVPVLGHSMSALCAFVFAVRRPERVSKLVLIRTPPGGWLVDRSVPRYAVQLASVESGLLADAVVGAGAGCRARQPGHA
jgi:pimeloyl-ACP methyl ester carboxylesterase